LCREARQYYKQRIDDIYIQKRIVIYRDYIEDEKG